MQEYHFTELSSTQDYAKKLYLAHVENFVVYADIQRAGRGRNGHTWSSPSGGLWFSFDMDMIEDVSLFTMGVGVAVREVLESIYGCNVKLKWPNDIILNRKKVGGIICEKVKDKVIVGVGINTNIKQISEGKATTFLAETEKEIDNSIVMNKIILRCKEVLNNEIAQIVEKFRKNMEYRGEICFVSALKKELKIIDVADNGYLMVETDDGIKEVSAGEINLCI